MAFGRIRKIRGLWVFGGTRFSPHYGRISVDRLSGTDFLMAGWMDGYSWELLFFCEMGIRKGWYGMDMDMDLDVYVWVMCVLLVDVWDGSGGMRWDGDGVYVDFEMSICIFLLCWMGFDAWCFV